MTAARLSPGAISESSSSHLPTNEASNWVKPVMFPLGRLSAATKLVYRVGSVGEQPAVSGIVRIVIDRRYVVSGRRQYDRHAMRGHEWIRRDDKAASRLAPKRDDGRFDLYVAMDGRNDWCDLE